MNIRRNPLVLAAGLACATAFGLPLAAKADDTAKPGAPSREGAEFFENKIRPLFIKHCHSCHSADAKKLGGELRLDTKAGLLAGGASGKVIVPGDPEKSLLIQNVREKDPALRMPPKEALSAAEIADLEAWVKMGAPDPRGDVAVAPKAGRFDLAKAKEFWAFRPVANPPLPAVKDAAWPLNEVDRFVLAKLEAKGLKPVPAADKRTLIRRATFDLTGLPPTPEEIDAFLKDETPDAFAKVVDRLLASPAYGERWGRHWLDVVRYSDTAGDNSDYPIPQIHRYRDWVIAAFNRDLRYDEFVRHQLAGDLLPSTDEPDRQAKLIATGYLANSRRFGSYEEARYPWYLTIEDTIDNFGRTFLGLTVNCSRCHDHKFDPISQEDYYALYGFFSSTRYPRAGIELDKMQRDFVPLASPEEVEAAIKEREPKVAELKARLDRANAQKAAVDIWFKAVRAKPFSPFHTIQLAAIQVQVNQLGAAVTAAKKEHDALAKAPLPFPTVYAVAERPAADRKKVGNVCVHIKGDPERLGPEVPRRFPTILGGQTLAQGTTGSGRLELADWLTDPKNPLFARVMVNRVWQYHFGRGIVQTSSNFGALGLPPTHPELLDYLAGRFAADGWSVKAMHRLMMLSRTYQMASRDDAASARIDTANDFLWRFNRRRLDAESIRDAMLTVSGNLDRSPGGEHPFPHPTTWDFTQHKPFKAVYDSNRRSVYLMTQRIQRHPFLALFDGADTNASTANRVTSTTPLQALFLMNDPFAHAQAKGLAKRVTAETGDDTRRIESAYLLLYGRPPTAEEITTATDYLTRASEKLRANKVAEGEIPAKAWESLARALFMSNEFVYVD